MLYNMFINQSLSIKVRKFLEKSGRNIWSELINALLLHPLSRTKAAIDWHSERDAVLRYRFQIAVAYFLQFAPETKKRALKKKLSKMFGRYAVKFLPLQPLSERKSVSRIDKRSMIELHKQYK